jgi:hypothetical protein
LGINTRQNRRRLNVQPFGNVLDIVTFEEKDKEYYMTESIWPFIDNNDGTVTDIRSKLVWIKSPIQFSKTDYNNSSILVRNIKSADYGINDNSIVGAWRLPTLQEFKSFVEIYANIDESKYNTPYDWLINRGITANKDALYWTATSSANDPDGAWAINLLTGKADYPDKNTQLYVWPVRSKSESQSAKSKLIVARQPVNVVTNNITTLNNPKDEIIKHNEESKNEFDIIHMVFKHIDICYFIFCVVLLIYAYTCGSFVFGRALVFVISSYVVFYVLCKISR